MSITNYQVSTCMGKVNTYFGHPLPFLSPSEKEELDLIGYTGKNSEGVKTNRCDYLNTLDKGQFQVEQIKFDNGDFSERLIVTNVCNRKCPGCCNVGWKGPQPKLMTFNDLKDYDTIIITGGEPLLYPEKVIDFMNQFTIQDFILYTASMCDERLLTDIFFHPNLSGITFTIHDQKGLDEFERFNKILKNAIHDCGLSFSLRLNIFPADVVLRPMDLSGWNVKLIEWIVDCPVPNDEDFGMLVDPWGGKSFN